MNFNGTGAFGGTGNWSGDIDIGGDVKVGGVIKMSDGTETAPSLTYTSETNLGFYKSATKQMSFVSNNHKRVNFNDTSMEVVPAGGTSDPSLQIGATDTGFCNLGSSIGIVGGGSLSASFSGTAVAIQVPTSITGSLTTGTNPITGGDLTGTTLSLSAQSVLSRSNNAGSNITRSVPTNLPMPNVNTTSTFGTSISFSTTSSAATLTAGYYTTSYDIVYPINGTGYFQALLRFGGTSSAALAVFRGDLNGGYSGFGTGSTSGYWPAGTTCALETSWDDFLSGTPLLAQGSLRITKTG